MARLVWSDNPKGGSHLGDETKPSEGYQNRSQKTMWNGCASLGIGPKWFYYCDNDLSRSKKKKTGNVLTAL